MSAFLASEPGHDRSNIRPTTGGSSQARATPAQSQYIVPLNVALYALLGVHLIATSNAPIFDCDETYNYWEPLHYLVHGSGFQTWEYSPDYSIRSWAYIFVHAAPIKLLATLGASKTFQFYSLRCLLGTVCAATEIKLYSAISRTLHPRIGLVYLAVCVLTPGFFFASTAFLPSTFAMYTATLGLTSFMDWTLGGPHTAQGLMFFGLGAILGWPFSAALIMPFVLKDFALMIIGQDYYHTFRTYLDGSVRCLIILALQVCIDTFFYRKPTFASVNAVLYNVFSSAESGPDIFGTEPWHFYFRNLILNFNIFFVLALLTAPILLVHTALSNTPATKQTLFSTLTFISPFYLWLGILSIQPHKEERFMFPAYPFLALNASISTHILLDFFNSSSTPILNSIPPRLKTAFITTISTLSVVTGLSRTTNLVTSYSAPFNIYTPLTANSTSGLLCLGKEWYRFPTSFLLPPQITPAFIKSEFSGLLPGRFHESETGFGLFSGAWLVPSGMNDRNIEDMGKYTDIRSCTWLVDSDMPSTRVSKYEQRFIESREWEKVKCDKFLDSQSTGLVGRIVWWPSWIDSFAPMRYAKVWGEYCLLKRVIR